jgi:hypothetical protein
LIALTKPKIFKGFFLAQNFPPTGPNLIPNLLAGIGFPRRIVYTNQWVAYRRSDVAESPPKLARTWQRNGVESSGATGGGESFFWRTAAWWQRIANVAAN